MPARPSGVGRVQVRRIQLPGRVVREVLVGGPGGPSVPGERCLGLRVRLLRGGEEDPFAVRVPAEDGAEAGADEAGRVVGELALEAEPVGSARDHQLGEDQADHVQRDEQQRLAVYRLVLPVPEGPEPAAEVGEDSRGGDGERLGLKRSHVIDAVQHRRAAQVDDGAEAADYAELDEFRTVLPDMVVQVGEWSAHARGPLSSCCASNVVDPFGLDVRNGDERSVTPDAQGPEPLPPSGCGGPRSAAT